METKQKTKLKSEQVKNLLILILCSGVLVYVFTDNWFGSVIAGGLLGVIWAGFMLKKNQKQQIDLQKHMQEQEAKAALVQSQSETLKRIRTANEKIAKVEKLKEQVIPTKNDTMLGRDFVETAGERLDYALRGKKKK